ncbi:S8 family peptidase [Rarobacter incanus]|uniref:Subtilisin family serine protease n=1 Tax=Rarobacter incanus TaxID=153494 RepID=A0A542SPX7_9MICO|nr:S8 family serine peptidase [Rarobacter incanus]TQK76628.1 subtilisin family serine protease [Rarobacter incanus]
MKYRHRIAAALCATALVGATLSAAGGAVAAPLPSDTTPPAAADVGADVLSAEAKKQAEKLAKDPDATASVIAVFDAGVKAGASKRRTASARSKIAATRKAIVKALPAGHATVKRTYTTVSAIAVEVDGQGLAALSANPAVTAIQTNKTVKKSTLDEANTLTGADEVQLAGYTGDGATVAILDTGVDITDGVVHPGLADNLVGQACFADDGCDEDDATDTPADDESHGTHVAGIITGPNGVAPGADFYAIKVLDSYGYGDDAGILAALDYVTELNDDAAGTVDFVNLSLGGGDYTDADSCNSDNAAYKVAFANLNAQGVSNFVATGNDESTSSVSAPACVDGAIGVGSVDVTDNASADYCYGSGTLADQVSCYSNATAVQGPGQLVDIVAPGCEITSLGLAGTDDVPMCGTSMATPYAVGVAALTKEIAADKGRKAFTAAGLQEFLERTGVQVKDPRIKKVTFPRVSPPAILAALTLDPPTGLAVDPQTDVASWDPSANADHYVVTVVSAVSGERTQHEVRDITQYSLSNESCGELSISVAVVTAAGVASVPSDEVRHTLRQCPQSVTDVSLEASDDVTNEISWALPVVGPEDVQITAISVESRVAGGSWARLGADLPATKTSYSDVPDVCGLVYYRVTAVAGNGDRSAPSGVVYRSMCAPANDLIADATEVSFDGPQESYVDSVDSIRWATRSDTDPLTDCTYDNVSNTVWYKVEPAQTGRIRIDTAGSKIYDLDYEYDEDMGVVTAVFAGEPNEDNQLSCLSTYGSDLTTVDVTGGETYYVMVGSDGELDRASDSILQVSISSDFSFNDSYANALPITATPFKQIVTDAASAGTFDENPFHACATGGPRQGGGSLWWTITPSVSGYLNVGTGGSTGAFNDTVVSVFTQSGSSFDSVACSDDAFGSIAGAVSDVKVSAGATYFIVVSRYSEEPAGDEGSVALTVSLNDKPTYTVTGGSTGGGTIIETHTVVKVVNHTKYLPVTTYSPKIMVGARLGAKAAVKVKKRKAKKVTVVLANLGNATDALRFKASKAPKGFTVKVRNAKGKDVTRAVRSRKFKTGRVAAGKSVRLTVVIKAKKGKKKTKGAVRFTVTSVSKPARVSKAKVVVRR